MTKQNYLLRNGLPATVREARALGTKHYFTGKACPKGHVAQRLTRLSHCCECVRLNNAWAKANPELHAERMREWRGRNPTYHLDYNRSHPAENFAYNFKYRFADQLSSDYGIKDQEALIALFHERNRLTKETGKYHFIAIVDTDKPINRFNVAIRTKR